MVLKKVEQRNDGLLKHFDKNGKLKKGLSAFDYIKARNEYMKSKR